MPKNIHKSLKIGAFLLILCVFCYFRLKPIYSQTVGYTFDQGRDFLKAAEVILYGKPTFIGPTTGIMGIFHGAWWYYLLTIPFVLFRGSPIGFYYFNFFIQLGAFFLLAIFLKKYFDLFTAYIISLLVAVSPYFISTSIFLGNNVIVLPFLLLFLIVNFLIIEKKIKKKERTFAFLLGLFLGFIAEFEFAFGLLLIPTYFILLLGFPPIRTYIFKSKRWAIYLIGLLIPFLPRIFFELRHGFLQTKTLLSFLLHPKLFTPKPYADVFKDRQNLFVGYFKGIFTHDPVAITILIAVIFCLSFTLYKKSLVYKNFLYFLFLLLGLLFVFSTLYKDTFWVNYYEGIQYIFLLITAVSLAKTKSFKYLTLIKSLLIIVIIFFASQSLIKELKSKPNFVGLPLRNQLNVVLYVQSQEKNLAKYCVKIYTPPVIPYTYNYLFLSRKLSSNIATPDDNWVHNRCWFIIETDDYKKRQTDWIKANIPQAAKVLTSKMLNGVTIELISK